MPGLSFKPIPAAVLSTIESIDRISARASK